MSLPPDDQPSTNALSCPRCQHNFNPTELIAPGAKPVFYAGSLTPEAGEFPTRDQGNELPFAGGVNQSAIPSLPTHPTLIARFQISRFVGEGSFGRVYEALDPTLKRTVAL